MLVGGCHFEVRMVRRRRRWVAGLVAVGVIFAQIVTVAHACGLSSNVSPMAAAFNQPTRELTPSDCGTMAKHVAADAKVCELQCTYDQQIDVQPNAPVAAIGPQRALTVAPGLPIAEPSVDTIALHARSTAPPVSLLFSRFLI